MYIIAEFGNMHEGSVHLAKKFIEVGKSLGVDCVKFQAHYFDEESLINAPAPSYFNQESRESYFNRTSFSVIQWKELKLYADEVEIDFMVSPFSLYAVDVLLNAGITRLKIASGEVTNLPLLNYINTKADEVFISSGMSSLSELKQAVKLFNNNNLKRRVLFQCSSIYPCPPEKVGLNLINSYQNNFPDWEIGLSDHTLSSTAGVLSVCSGATVIEKHLTLSNLMYGSDAKNSLEPQDFELFVKSIREAQVIINSPLNKDEEVLLLGDMKHIFEKSIVYSRNLSKGKILEFSDLNFKKPGDGISANKFEDYIGKKLTVDVVKNQKLNNTNFK